MPTNLVAGHGPLLSQLVERPLRELQVDRQFIDREDRVGRHGGADRWRGRRRGFEVVGLPGHHGSRGLCSSCCQMLAATTPCFHARLRPIGTGQARTSRRPGRPRRPSPSPPIGTQPFTKKGCQSGRSRVREGFALEPKRRASASARGGFIDAQTPGRGRIRILAGSRAEMRRLRELLDGSESRRN